MDRGTTTRISLKGGTKATWIVYVGRKYPFAVKGLSALRYAVIQAEEAGFPLDEDSKARYEAAQAAAAQVQTQAGLAERYEKKVTLYAKLPDGRIVDRTTDHPYKFVVAVKRQPEAAKARGGEWGYTRWSKTPKAAQAALREYSTWGFAELRLVPVFETRAEAEAAEVA
jgi:hypothetical protein